MADKKECRAIGELRAVEEDGTFEGYLTVWDTVDDYNSTFQRGSFANTIQKRGSRVKILYDHTHLIGSSLELREDDHGVYGKGKLNLEVDKAKEAYSFMKDGTLDGLSFQFRSIKEGFSNGVRILKEVDLFEFGPVTFPANDDAVITGLRSQNFEEFLEDEALYRERRILQDALDTTLSDIWWGSDTTSENVVGKLDKALSDHHVAYLDFSARWVTKFWSDTETRESPFGNGLSKAVCGMLSNQKTTLLAKSSETSFTLDELTELRNGNLIPNRNELVNLSQEIAEAHSSQRNKTVELLCTELREMLTPEERVRITALLKPLEERKKLISSEEANIMIDYFKNFNQPN